MRRLSLFLLLLLLAIPSIAGKRNEQDLIAATKAFDRALETKDSLALQQLMSPDLRYGHSNGWIETKEEVIADLYNGKLTYKSIAWTGSRPSVLIDGNTGLVRGEVAVDVVMNGNPLSLKLSVLQVWMYKKGKWILIGRQSGKVG